MCIVICTLLLSRPARGAWVEIYRAQVIDPDAPSRPARGAWVEISTSRADVIVIGVAPRKGRVG